MDAQWPRFINDLVDRLTGPLHFRFLMQPAMAIFFGLRDGLKDAKRGKPAYSWELLTDPVHRAQLIREGLRSVLKILILAVILDAIYQVISLHWFYVGEDLLVAIGLAFVPYFLIRGPVNRVARWWTSHPHHVTPNTRIPDERNSAKTR